MIIAGNIAFQGLSLAVLGVWCWMVYAFRGPSGRCLKTTVTFLKTSQPRPEAAVVYDNFLRVALALGAMTVGLAVVKLTSRLLAEGTGIPGTMQWELAGWAGPAGLDGLPIWIAPAAVVAVALAGTVLEMVEIGVLKAAGGLTLSSKFTDEIVRIKKNWIAAVSILSLPLVVTWSGVNPERDRWIAYIFGGVIVIFAVLFSIQTMRGFIRQKVSLLVWFLYLCTVEIFPLGTIVLVVARNI
jgi:hypothetical protein